jgi:hypothetical protein
MSEEQEVTQETTEETVTPEPVVQETNTEEMVQTKIGAHDPFEVPKQFIDDENGELKLADLVDNWKDQQDQLKQRTPEAYEFEEMFTEHELAFANDEQETEVVDLFKKHRLSQEAANDFIAMYGQRAKDMMGAEAEEVAPTEETAALYKQLQTNWGDDTESNLHAINDAITEKMVSEKGVQEMYQYLVKDKQGPTTMKETFVATEDLQTQLYDIQSNPHYNNPMSPENKRLHERADQVASKIAARK